MVGHQLSPSHIVIQICHYNANQEMPCYSPLRSTTRHSLVGIIMGYLDGYMAGRLYVGLP